MTDRLHLTSDQSLRAVRWLSDAADGDAAAPHIADRVHDRWLAAKSHRVALDLDEAQQLWIALDLHIDLSAKDAALLDKVTPFAFPDLIATSAAA